MVSELLQAIEVMPEDISFRKNLLQIRLDRHEWQAAETLTNQCISADSTDAQALCVRGQLYEMRGEIDQALTDYRRSYALDSTQANVCSYIGRIYYNKAVILKKQLYDQRRFREIDAQLQPIYDEALPWYELAYQFDTSRQDASVPTVIREILYSRFTKVNCPNSKELIAQYNKVSKAYGLAEFGK